MASAAILDFEKFNFLTFGRLKRVEMLRRAKFGTNRSNRGRDVTIFGFFKDGSHPPSWICDACFRTTDEGYLVVFITVQSLVGIDRVVSMICKFYYFAT